jgi:hypothetical protein
MTLVEWNKVVEAMSEMSYHLENYCEIVDHHAGGHAIQTFDSKGYAKEILDFILETEAEE